MYKLLYDNKFTDVDKPLPNLQHIFPTNHSEIFAHFGQGFEHSEYIQYTSDEFEDDVNYIYYTKKCDIIIWRREGIELFIL